MDCVFQDKCPMSQGQVLCLMANGLICGASQVVLVVKNPPANARDIKNVSSIHRLGRSPGEGNGSPLQYSCLENPMDREAWRLQSTGSQRVRRD